MPSLALLAFAAALAVAVRADGPPHIADPLADPKDDPYNPLHYIPTEALTLVAQVVFEVIATAHMWCLWRWRSWWMTCLVVGEITLAFGFICRGPLHNNPDSIVWYTMESLLTVLSPCAFIAADYIIFGRLVRELRCEHHLRLIPARRITLVFITSDLVTLNIQGGGAGLLTKSAKVAQTGTRIILAGLIVQLLSFLFFTAVFGIFVYRVRKHEPQIWERDRAKGWFWDWRTLAAALGVSCIGILIRSVYRTAEMAQGSTGPLTTTEVYFYTLDTLPLFIAVVPFWPGRFIRAPPKPKSVDEQRDNFELVGQATAEPEGRSTHDASSGDRILVA